MSDNIIELDSAITMVVELDSELPPTAQREQGVAWFRGFRSYGD